MTDKEQRMAIAEACGWSQHPKDRWIVIHEKSPHRVQPFNMLPDYTRDLNAMHEAEKVLFSGHDAADMREKYWMTLYDVCQTTDWPFDATAPQRAEAFLRTLGLWGVASYNAG